MTFHYTFEGGSYYFKDSDNNRVLYMVDEVAFLYSEHEEDGITFHGHGDEKSLKSKFDAIQIMHKENPDLYGEPKIISGKFPIDEVNKVINNCLYIGHFIEKMTKLSKDII